MRRLALLLLTLSLLAFGCEVGALCSAAQASDSSCCCPLMAAMGMEGTDLPMDGTPPCMDESDGMPMPGDSEATFDGVAQAWDLAPAPAAALACGAPQDLVSQATHDLAAGHGRALYLLGCSFLN